MRKKVKRIFEIIYCLLPYIWWIGIFLFSLISYLLHMTESIVYVVVVSAVIATVTDIMLMLAIKLVICVIKRDIDYNKKLKRKR